MSDLGSVLKALNQSSKLKHWHKPPREFGPENPEDSDYNRNGLKDVGDLSKISFSSRFSFGDEETKEEDKPENTWPETTTELESRLEESIEVHRPVGNDSLEMGRRAREQYNLILKMKALALEKECQLKVKERSSKWHEAYLNKLNDIRAASEHEWNEYILREEDKLAHEENHLKEQVRATQEAINECQNEYSKHVAECSRKLMDAFECAQRQEAEEANTRKLHLTNLKGLYSDFCSHVEQMQKLYKDLEGSEALDAETECLIKQTETSVQEVISTGDQGAATEEQLVKAQATLDKSFTSVKEITQSLHVKKEEKAKLEQEKASREAEANKVKAELASKSEIPEAPRQELQDNLGQEERTPGIEIVGINTFNELKEKVQIYVDAKKSLTPDQMFKLALLAKPANQLSVNDQSINRDRLQQMLGRFAGRFNNPSELLHLKSLVARNLVKLGTDHDKPTTAVCSWFIVNLGISHPDMYDIFFYYLFTECHGLALVLRNYPANQSLDYLHQLMGRREDEKEDKFSGRNGKAACMYGMILAMIHKNKRSQEQAPVRGWQLMAKIFSAPPVSCVTGEIILEFLKSFGFALQDTYRKQFLKLMIFLIKVYFPKIEQVKGETGGQCFALLQEFLIKFKKTGKLQQDPLISKYRIENELVKK